MHINGLNMRLMLDIIEFDKTFTKKHIQNHTQ